MRETEASGQEEQEGDVHSLVKPAPLTGLPVGGINPTVAPALHAAVRLPDTTPEKRSAGVTGVSSVLYLQEYCSVPAGVV